MKDPFSAPHLSPTPPIIPPPHVIPSGAEESRIRAPFTTPPGIRQPYFFQTKNTPNSIDLSHKINQTRPDSITKSNQLQARTPGNE